MQLNGREFQSWDDFCVFLQEWSKEQYLLHSSSVIEEGSNQEPNIQDVAEILKYSWAQLSCSWYDKTTVGMICHNILIAEMT